MGNDQLFILHRLRMIPTLSPVFSHISSINEKEKQMVRFNRMAINKTQVLHQIQSQNTKLQSID